MGSQLHPGSVRPIIFALPGVNADTNLEVFDQAFHVESHILILHSALFRKFLESADKTKHAGNTFQYHYKTQVDSDGMWGLEAAVKIACETPAELLKANKTYTQKEIAAFNKLLSAMYMRTYKVADIVELEILIRLADFYCALPALSSSLYVALLDRKGFANQIPSHAQLLLPLAYNLRQPLLYRECLMHVVGSLKDDRERFYSNQAPDNAVTVQYRRLCHNVDMTLCRLDFYNEGRSDLESEINAIEGAMHYYSGDLGPGFFRELYHRSYKSIGMKTAIQYVIAPLLKNNPKLYSSHGELAKT